MTHAKLPGTLRLRVMISTTSSGLCAVGGALLVAQLYPVLRFSAEQLLYLSVLIGIYTVPMVAVAFLIQKRWLRGTLAYLELVHRGEDPPRAVAESAFADAVDLPRRYFRFNFLTFLIGGVLIASALVTRFEDFDAQTGLIMFLAAVSAGVATQIFIFIFLKMVLEPVRTDLAHRLESPELRQGLVRVVSMPRQLFVTVVGLTFTTALFAMLLSQGRALRFLETHTTRGQAAVLERLLDGASGASLQASIAGARDVYGALGFRFLLLDAEGVGVTSGDDGLLTDEELRNLRAAGLDAGDSLGFDSPNSFTWRRVSKRGPLLVALLPGELMRTDLSSTTGLILLAAIGMMLLAVAAALAASRDLSKSIGLMREQISRITAGDLTRSVVFESENELGELSRAMDGMRGSLRDALGWILVAADEVRGSASEIGTTTRDIAEASLAQAEGVAEVTRSIDLVNDQMGSIAESASGLDQGVSQSSGAVEDLEAGSSQLGHGSVLLTERANETSRAIEEMTGSLDQVVQSTDHLAEAVQEASASLTEIVVQVAAVEETADEATRLSQRVVKTAQDGRERVAETIDGMDKIQEATETAERVMGTLVERSSSIGHIVNVIEDVADETNLLALNAAIIAAQAGEHGRAFSVVADEVRDLADRVSSSTKEIGTLIHDLQQESSNAQVVVRQGSEQVRSGVDRSAQAGVSLEEITVAAQQSGRLIGEIVNALGEHARASKHVVQLMERVSHGVDEIRTAGLQQKRAGHQVLEDARTVDEVAGQVRSTAEAQARSTGRITESIQQVRETVTGLHGALQQQREACGHVIRLVAAIKERTDHNENSARTTDLAARTLLERFEALRDDVEQRFRL